MCDMVVLILSLGGEGPTGSSERSDVLPGDAAENIASTRGH